MKHSLASVVVLGVVLGCSSSEDADEASANPATSSDGTGGDRSSAESTTGVLDGDSMSGTTSGSGGYGPTSTNGTTSGPGTSTGGPANVDGPGGLGEGGDNGSGADDSGGEVVASNYPENPFASIAMTRAQRQALLDARNNTGSVSTTGSVTPDPDDLWVAISDMELVCTEFPSTPCGGHWVVDLMLTEQMRAVGTYDLYGEWFGTHWSDVSGDPNLPDDCGGGASGGISTGTLEVLEINNSEIRFRLDADPWSIDADIKGIYTASICP